MLLHSAEITQVSYLENGQVNNMKKNIVITKTAAISPIGVGILEFLKNIQKENKPAEITIFDTAKYKNKNAFVLNNFDGKEILGEKGLRNFNRNTVFILSAIKKDLDNELTFFKENNKKLGLTIGTAFGSLASISDYELEIFAKTPRKINPMGFGNTVLNSPASRANIWFGLTAMSSTISAGGISGAKAIEFSIDQIEDGNVEAMICGGAEEINMQSYLGYYLNNFLTENNILCTYNAADGTILSEGCAAVLLESEDSAKKRNAQILATISGYGTSFYGSYDNLKNFETKGVVAALENAFNEAKIQKSEIDLIVTSASGLKKFDMMEEKALIEVFGENIGNIPIIPLKSIIGESIGASNLFQLVIASHINELKSIKEVYKYSKEKKCFIKDKNFAINYSNFKKILLNCSAECGNHSAIILKTQK
jgi:3-oxoacyl-[acyl-carrier-protein] synthase II